MSEDFVSIDSDSSDSRPYTRSSLRETVRKLDLQNEKFMENFNPETSARERRKLTRKLNPGTTRKVTGAIYDETGSYISDGQNLCDCLFPDCPGCHFPCAKCGSEKCGTECRVNRKYIYETVDLEGTSKTFKNTHGK